MNKISIMFHNNNKNNISVTNLIRKLNLCLNIKAYDKKIPCTCICMFRLYNLNNIHKNCIVHNSNNEKNKVINLILDNFIHKNLIYIKTLYFENIIYNRKLIMMLPLIIHININKNNICHFHDKRIPIKLNNKLVLFTNLLILNFISCDYNQNNDNDEKCKNYNYLLSINKCLKFKYGIFINCKSKLLQNYIIKTLSNDNNIFILKLSKFLNNS